MSLLFDAGTEPVTRVPVTVTFLRQDVAPACVPIDWPPGITLTRVPAPDVILYRMLYDTVGRPYLWWLRRVMSDTVLAAHLASPRVSLHLLRRGEAAAGFYELDGRGTPTVNISYFGLMPDEIGRGLGMRLLRSAIAEAWSTRPAAVTVNTCTADHRRALPNYLACGFRIVRAIREEWPIPDRLGLPTRDFASR